MPQLAHAHQIESLQDVLLIDPETRQVEHYHRGLRGWKVTTRKRGALAILGGVIQISDLFEGLELETAEE